MDIPDVIRWRDRVAQLNDDLSGLLESSQGDVQPGSPALRDGDELGHLEPVRTAFGQSLLLCESASEHIAAATNSLKEPAQILACFSCVRTATEVASLSWWLMDPALDYVERISRSLALRRKGLDEQRRLLRENPEADRGHIPGRYAAIDEGVRTFGLSVVQVPPATDLVARTFGDRTYYRLGSAVVHGHAWALMQVGFVRTEHDAGAGIVPLQKKAKPQVLVYLLMLGLEALGRPLWASTRYAGGDYTAIEGLLGAAYRDLRIAQANWFWMRLSGRGHE